MKISLQWLKTQSFFPCPQPISLEELTRFMPLRGFEVEAVIPVGDDQVIDFSITPNRGDCLSMRGLAREIACLYNLPFTDITSLAKAEASLATIDTPIQIRAPKACLCYAGRFIRHIPKNTKAPAWLIDRLTKAGIESIHPIIDICNYVMIALGQPLHAFDADKIKNLHVRFAKSGEKIEVLGGHTLTLSKNTVVIADENAAQAVAGVIGGMQASVHEDTTSIFLESAHFTPEAITGRARQYGLNTEAAQRFERGVDPTLPLTALEQVTHYILKYLGGDAEPIQLVEGKKIPKTKTIRLRYARLQRLLGLQEISHATIKNILLALGLSLVGESKTQWKVIPPHFRFDLQEEEDVIEEIARVHGYEKIVAKQPQTQQSAPAPKKAFALDRWRQTLVQRGYHETINYSFISEQVQTQCFPHESAMRLKNPLSSEFSVLRTSLWPSLLLAWQYNLHRQQLRAKIFEIGRVYHPHPDFPKQPLKLAGLLSGSRLPEQWAEKPTEIDFFEVKADVEALLFPGFQKNSLTFKPTPHPMLHAGQAAEIFLEEKSVGTLGRLHPALQQKFDFPQAVYVFEIDIAQSFFVSPKHYQPISCFPSVRRDFAFWVNRLQPVDEILQAVKKHLGVICQEVILFDVYPGSAISADQKSIAFGVVLQAIEETLSDEQVNPQCTTLVAQLTQQFSMQLRDQ